MQQHSITMLGTGLIGDFYTTTLHGQRSRDHVQVVYSRSAERGEAFQARHGIAESTTDMAAAIQHPDTDVVVVGCRTSSMRRRSAWSRRPARPSSARSRSVAPPRPRAARAMSALAALMIAPTSCSDVRFTWAPGGWPDGAA
jgi:hypothetical protein